MTDTISLRIPPQNIDAERAVIGAIMIRPDEIDTIGMVLASTDFYGIENQILYSALEAMHKRNEVAIDAVTLGEHLQRSGQLGTIGGVAYIATLLIDVPEASHGIHYARIVRDKSRARALIQACHEAMAVAYESEDPDDIIDSHARRIEQIRESETSEIATAAEAVESLIERRQNPRQIHKTGIWQLDQKLIGGMRDGDILAVGGRPGTGKTVLLSQICQGVLRNGGTPLFVSLEMTKEELVDRMSRELSLESIAETSILFMDAIFDFERIAALIRVLARQRKLDVVVVDYIQLCEITLGKGDNREREIATMSRRFKKLAKSLKVPIVIGSQLNRESTKRGKPTLADMRESGAIEQDASVVILLSKSDNDEETLIDVAKHRGGPIGEIRMVLNGPKFRFDDPVIYSGDM